MIVRLGRAAVRWGIASAGIFYRVERVGPELPPGPVILVANHPNMLTDPLLALGAARRRVRVLAKAPLFDIPIFGHILRAVDTLPLYRLQDDPDLRHRNRLAFQEAVDELYDAGTLLTFPEGGSRSLPMLAPLKRGAARVALAAEAQSGWRLGIKIVPIGLNYERKERFRSPVVAAVGSPIEVGEWRDEHESAAGGGAKSLTRAIARGLYKQTLNTQEFGDRALLETADLVLRRERDALGWRERVSLAERLPRLRRHAERHAWLQSRDPTRGRRLSRSLRRYSRRLRRVGAGDADVPRAGELKRGRSEVLRDAAALTPAALVAAAGVAAWYLPCFVAWLFCRLMRPAVEMVATVKLLTGMVILPLYYIAVIAAAGRWGGLAAAALAATVLPLLAAAALKWSGRMQELWTDFRLASLARRKPGLCKRTDAQRAALAAELSALAREFESERSERQRAEPWPSA